MSKMFQVYGIGQALIPVLPPPLPFQNPPNINQTNYEIGQLVYTPAQSPTAFYLYGGAGNWIELATNTGAILSINGTASQVAVTTLAGVATVSLPAAITTPGSLTTTTTLTAGTGLTVTTGNITLSAAGSGIVTSPVVGTTGASPIVANGRVVSATFSGVSIAAGATQALTITNSAITASSQIGLTSWAGATAGSALTLQSVVNVVGATIFTFTNGTGATTSTANITITYLLLN
jgi:hypothetical protein